MDRRELREQNRRSWDAVVGAHDSHRGDLAAFLRGDGSMLFPEERRLLGDLAGKTLVHLQCNSGGDTLSLALLGAEVTGVDISDGAISSAHALSNALLPYVQKIAGRGLVDALNADPGLARGAAVVWGRAITGSLADDFETVHHPLRSVLPLHGEAR